MGTKLEYKIINYFGDYGTANFWSNISFEEIDKDLSFIKKSGFNSIIIMLPYNAFKPVLDSFESKYTETLNYLLAKSNELDIKVIARIGYLWESNFAEDRTLERFIDIYSSCKQHISSKYEQDFVSFVNHYYDNYSFDQLMISWEDFFWPIAFYNESRNNDNQENERETIALMEHLLSLVGEKDRLFVEQRTNGDFNKISYNPAISYAYYNTYNIQSWDDEFINKNFGRGILISDELLIPKQFIEWYSRMKQELSLNEQNKLIIDQFNIIDNTFSDDDDHEDFNKSKQLLLCDESNLNETLDFIAPVIKNNVYGIGFWSLWSTYAGHVYNGTFKFGAEGWDTNAPFSNGNFVLSPNDYISTNLGYIRLDNMKSWNILLKYSSQEQSKIMLKFNNQNQIIELAPGSSIQQTFKFNVISDRNLKIECLSGSLTIERIDCFNIMHKSIIFNEDRTPAFGYEAVQNLLN